MQRQLARTSAALVLGICTVIASVASADGRRPRLLGYDGRAHTPRIHDRGHQHQWRARVQHVRQVVIAPTLVVNLLVQAQQQARVKPTPTQMQTQTQTPAPRPTLEIKTPKPFDVCLAPNHPAVARPRPTTTGKSETREPRALTGVSGNGFGYRKLRNGDRVSANGWFVPRPRAPAGISNALYYND